MIPVGLTFAMFGLVFGSFLTVVVCRMPERRSVVSGRSACPRCGVTIAARDNIPLASYVMLRGRCRSCGAGISPEYPLTELADAGLFVAAALAVGSVWVAAVAAPFLGVLLAAALIDARHRIIPNRLMYPSLLVFGAAIVVLTVAGQPVSLATGLLGMLAYGGGLLVLAFLAPGGMGMGDVKLAALIGLVLGALGWAYVAVAAGGGVLAGGVGGLVALALGRSRKDAIPFGPFMALGGIVSLMFAPQVAAWYTALLG